MQPSPTTKTGNIESHITAAAERSTLDLANNEINCESALCSSNFNEIPEPIKTLDDILSEFEQPDSLPHVSLHENQSEDDGYMSLNGKSQMQEMPSSSTSIHLDQSEYLAKSTGTSAESTDNSKEKNSTALIQTLPKTRSTAANNKGNYSSLPCSSLRSNALDNKIRVGSCSGERNILGIDISAVHNAVLRGGVAKLPEPILNEHPVTIYPGRKHGVCSDQVYIHNCSGKLVPNFQLARTPQVVARSKEEAVLKNMPNYSGNLINVSSPTEYFNQKLKHLDTETNDVDEENSDEFSEDSLDGKRNAAAKGFQTRSSVSAVVTSYRYRMGEKSIEGRSSIAWEIKFQNNRHTDFRKATPKASNNPKTKNNNANKINACIYKISSKKDKREPLKSELCKPFKASTEKFKIEDVFKPYPKQTEHREFLDSVKKRIAGDDGDDDDEDDEDDENNTYTTTFQGNMLGKGTFIIRRRPRYRILQNSDVYDDKSEPSAMNSQEEKNDGNGEANEEPFNKSSLKKPTTTHAAALQKLNRARLSLNLEPEHVESSVIILNKPQTKQTNTNETTKELQQHHSEYINSTTSSSTSLESSKKACDQATNIKLQAINCIRSPDSNEHILNCTTPHRDLAPPLEEEEEQCSESQSGCAPLRQIEHNISALLRGDMAVARIGDCLQSRRSLGYRPGVHKSESAKEMLLSQNAFGPLPPSPPSSSPELNEMPPLPPSPSVSPAGTDIDDNMLESTEFVSTYNPVIPLSKDNSRSNLKLSKYDLPLPPTPQEKLPPAVPPHRGSFRNQTAIRSRSIDSNYTRKCPKTISHSGSTVISLGYGSSAYDVAYTSRRGGGSYGLKLKQSPGEEQRLQTSCSLPETPIFARGCTPHRRQAEYTVGSGCRTAPRSGAANTPNNMGSSIVGISGAGICRQRTIGHALASGEMLRLSGGPARGWYPKQRSNRPASTENIDRIPTSHLATMRVWDSAGGGMTGSGQVRKPLTLPPNLTPSFLNKSPREALRRVTSLLINKKGGSKDRDKMCKENMSLTLMESNNGVGSISCKPLVLEASSKHGHNTTQKAHKKKGFFKQFWKKSKHYSLDQ